MDFDQNQPTLRISKINGGQGDHNRWKSPEMDELDLVLCQDIREFNWECVTFDIESFYFVYFFGILMIFSSSVDRIFQFLFNLESP